MRILVTGANGFLGRGITKELLDYGNEVVATDLSVEGVDDRADKIPCDLFAVEKPYEYFRCPDTVLHLAWRDGFIHNAPSHIEDLPKHNAFLRKMISMGIRQVAVMGSMHEIGFYEGCINEKTPCHPQNMYGIAKNALRESVLLMAEEAGVKFLWFRGFYIVSNSIYGSSIFSKIAQAQAKGQVMFPFTTGQNQYDFLNYDDFCAETAQAVTQSEVTGIINICSGRPEKLKERVERFIIENNYSIQLEYGAFPDRKYDSLAVWGDAEKIRKIMGKEE